MTTKVYIDTETVGLYGMPVLIQYAEEDGPITLFEPWRNPVRDSLQLIERLTEHAAVGFNLVFDWFHLTKLYTTFRLVNPDWIPQEHINEIAAVEREAQNGPCIKPASALDLLLHSRKGPYQALMARDDIRIKRTPTVMAYALAHELEKRVQLDGIYFARRADADAPRWQVFDRLDKNGQPDPGWKDVVLRFNPAMGLKFLAEHALGLKPKFHYTDVEPDSGWRPVELGYAPFAEAVSTAEQNWEVWRELSNGKPKLAGYAWPGVIHHFINHWATREDAREYATDDIVYTRALDKHFDYPEPGDDDSVLACAVASVRWRGFVVDIDGIKQLNDGAKAVLERAPVNINKPPAVREYIYEMMDDTEKIVLEDSTKKANLESVSNWTIDADEECLCLTGCPRCDFTGRLPVGKHPAAVRAQELLDVKAAAKEKELYTKLLEAGKFHASFNIIGAMSSRMSGADNLNPQGIKHTNHVRGKFPMAWDGYVLSLGDFSAFEVTIADAVCNDSLLREELLRGKKIHALFGESLFPGKAYEDIKASDGSDNDMYSKAKQGFFAAILYGGTAETLNAKLGIPLDVAKEAIESFGARFKGVQRWRARVTEQFCSMKQPGGIGSQVVWEDPADYCETILGFRRYFTLENAIAKALFELAQKPPKHFKDIGNKIKVCRRDRVQSAAGAVQSALFGAAFAIQSANVRAAANHEIQSAGAQITKAVQRHIWDLQPTGVHELVVAPANIHDEILCVNHPDYTLKVTEAVREGVERFRKQVPLIGMDWVQHAASWASKHGEGADDLIKITYKKEAES